MRKALKRDIPVERRDQWDKWLAGQRAEHERLTSEIVRLETELNAGVYELFGRRGRRSGSPRSDTSSCLHTKQSSRYDANQQNVAKE